MATTNRQITLAARPDGFPKESDFRLIESPILMPANGEFLARIIYLSVDPYMRGRMSDRPSYAPPVEIGGVMVGGAVGRVLESKNPPGTIVEGAFGWQEYAVSKGEGVRIVDPASAPISTALGVLGMPGFTAYFGLFDVCSPKPGETVVVSGAAGAVARVCWPNCENQGYRAVGIVADDKVAYLTEELAFDAAFNYGTLPSIRPSYGV